jgi:beta-galactosidase GanA
MNNKTNLLFKLFWIFLISAIPLLSIIAGDKKITNESGIPFLKKQGSATQLIVDGNPFLILAGELGNSSASDMNYLRPYWQNFKLMNLNTILAPVYWELIEPEEGKFDFTLVDSLIFYARQYNLKLVFLWFGSWKNSMSCYVPYWIKADEKRFPRARTKEGKALEILTPFNNESRNADAAAFKQLMKHIKILDENDHTVLMIQVENEIGMIPDAKDYSDEANNYFKNNVPDELINYLKTNIKTLQPDLYKLWKANDFKSSGNWEEVFGKGLHTDELFMAWYFAKYTNFIAQAGKKEYPVPMYVNAALIRPGYKPGQYPSAGPLPHLLDIWSAGAPQIDFIAPDIYFKNFLEWCEKYNTSGNPLFIPEAGNNQSIANAYYAVGQHNAMGYSPFSIESLNNPGSNHVSLGYNVLAQLTPLILKNQGKRTMAGVLLDSASEVTKIRLGNYIFNFQHEFSWPYAARIEGEVPRYGGLIYYSRNRSYRNI